MAIFNCGSSPPSPPAERASGHGSSAWKVVSGVSVCLSGCLAEGSGAHALPCKRKLKLVTLRPLALARRCFQVEELEEKGGRNNTAFSLSKSCRQTPSRFHEKERKTLSSSLKASLYVRPSTGSPSSLQLLPLQPQKFPDGTSHTCVRIKTLVHFFCHHLDDLNHSESGCSLLGGPEILHRCRYAVPFAGRADAPLVGHHGRSTG